MPTLAQWIRDLADGVRHRPPQVETHMRRVLVPGFQPLDAEGFVRFAGVKPIYRVGMPPEALSVVQWMSKSGGGGPTLDGFAIHLGAGLTLACVRRVEVLSELPLSLEETDQLTFVTTSETTDRRLVSPIQNADVGADFAALLAKLATLEGKAERAILVSIDLHYGAVLLFDRDLTAAYTLLVAAIETLSRQFGSPPSDWSSWEQATSWDEFAASQRLTPEQHSALKAKLMRDRELRLQKTFVNYVVTRLPDEFWDRELNEHVYSVDIAAGTWREGSWHSSLMRDRIPHDRALLASALRHSYRARSEFVHEGGRSVDLTAQLLALTRPADADRPLAFSVLRSILTTLVRLEVDTHSGDYELPSVRLTHGSEGSSNGQ